MGVLGPFALYLMAWKCKGKNKKKKKKKAKAKRKINKATSRETMPATAATTGRVGVGAGRSPSSRGLEMSEASEYRHKSQKKLN